MSQTRCLTASWCDHHQYLEMKPHLAYTGILQMRVDTILVEGEKLVMIMPNLNEVDAERENVRGF